MTLQEKTFELLERTHLNWTVDKLPLVSQDGHPTNSYGLFRSDNREHLATVGDRYEVMQNHVLAETIIEAADVLGLAVKHGNPLKGGRKLFFQTPLPEANIGAGGVKRNITAMNSHDGSTSIAFGTTNVVIKCENTFYRAFNSGELTRFRHTTSAQRRLEEALSKLRLALEGEEKLMADFRRMSAVDLDKSVMDMIMPTILKKGLDADPAAKSATISSRKRNQVLQLSHCINRELTDQGQTLWGLFNGVTRYTNHYAAPKHKQEEYVMVGAGAELNGLAFSTIMDWIDKHTAEPVLVQV